MCYSKSKWPQGGTVLKRLFLISAHFSERFPDFFPKIIKYNHKQTVVVNMYRWRRHFKEAFTQLHPFTILWINRIFITVKGQIAQILFICIRGLFSGTRAFPTYCGVCVHCYVFWHWIDVGIVSRDIFMNHVYLWIVDKVLIHSLRIMYTLKNLNKMKVFYLHLLFKCM